MSGPPTDQPPDWHGVHVYFYDDDRRDDLILDGIRPLLAQIEPVVSAAYFVRHWRRGPHVRVCVRAPAEIVSGIVDPAVADWVGGYLREHPSTAVVDEARLLRAHEQLARRELDPGPLWPLWPDNTIRRETCDRRLSVLGGIEAADLLERFYARTNAQAFTTLERVRDGAGLPTIGLDLMLATAQALWGDITRGFISYRAHAEGFMIQAAQPDRLRTAWDADLARQAPALAQRVHAVLAMLDGRRPPAPHVRDWLAAAIPFRDEAEALVRAGRLRLASGGEAGRANGWELENLPYSAFQQQLHGNTAYVDFLRNDPRFQGYRLMLNYLYLHLHRLGITAVERYHLCHLTAGAVEQALGVSALALVTR